MSGTLGGLEDGSGVRRWIHSTVRSQGVAHRIGGEAVLDELSAANHGRGIARLEDRRVDAASIRGDGQGARVLGVEGDAHRWRGEVGRVEDQDRVRLRAGDEGALGDPREDHVARLVVGRQSRAHSTAVEIDDGDRVADVIDDPRFAVVVGPYADGVDPDRESAQQCEFGPGRVEDLEACVGRVDGEQARAVRRQVERVGVRALPVDERALGVSDSTGHSTGGDGRADDR